MKSFTVKARRRTGSPAFDLTIPTEIVRRFNVRQGDIFEVTASKIEGDLVLKYKLVFKQK